MSNNHMMLIKRICDHLKRPFFEIMKWPASELEFWAVSFSITDNPKLPTPKPEEVSLEESKAGFKRVWG